MAKLYQDLVEHFRGLRGVLVAYSGGVDSSLLLAAAHDALGQEGCLAVTARSPLYAESETAQAKTLAASLGARHLVIDTCELDSPQVYENPPDRCYHCKHDKFTEMKAMAAEQGFEWVIEGSNADDLSDYRPGMRAVEELGLRSPLLELGWGKAEIRAAAKKRGIPNWDKPSTACLASRVPYGTPLTAETLSRIEGAEAFLHGLGFSQLRVRDHGPVARVEIEPQDFARLLDQGLRAQVVEGIQAAGYDYVALDLTGYRTGAMNEGLELDKAE